MGVTGDDPRQFRISDADRHAVADVLRDAAAQGRLGMDELDERLEAAFAARTYADLEPVVGDLPADPRTPRMPSSLPAGRGTSAMAGPAVPASVAVMSSCKRTGRWTVPVRHTAYAVMGDVILDLREADFAAREVTIVATAVMGDVKILVDEFTDVVVEGVPILGDFKQRRDKIDADVSADAPKVRVKGAAMLGDVSVQRLPPPGTPRRFLGRFR
jgi:predicted thioesterase